MRSGMPTFSAADSIGMSPKDWKMNATVLRRSASRSRSGIAVTSLAGHLQLAAGRACPGRR